ncbi:MAG: metal ABC transporter permease [Candidatus Liberibacter ctenarytainae]|uniref:Metal ABC transporter permease n=1 Tax=Candidatus Liberibacter ctenarytainae TaxID=2020335 RepID=A0A937AFN9_9HYPH|nr:metal ABC transporter permease [Candidatus Liberibacter ctenarytainae]
MINDLMEPFSYHYMVTAIWMSTLIGCVCGLLSAYLILKGWSSLGNGISHAIFPGVLFSYLWAIPFSISTIIAGILATGMMVRLKEKTKLKENVAVSIVYLSFYSFAMFVLSLMPPAIYVQNIFIGNVLSISQSDILQVLIISFYILVVMWIKWKDFALLFFDEEYAHSIGINVKFLKILFFTLLTASIVIGFQTSGILLVIATIIIPGATAKLLSKSFGTYLILSTVIGAISGFLGSYISYFLDCSPGGIIVLLQSFAFLLSIFCFSKQRIMLTV